MPRNTEEPTAVEVLKDVVAQKSNGEVRIQQQEMVEAIDSGLQNGEHVIVEAPTGSGKSIANLIPLITSGKKAVISTATKQLSEQIIENEIPFVQGALLKTHPSLKINGYAILKGRENYLCKKKEYEQAELSSRASSQLNLFDDGDNTGNISDEGKKFSAESRALDEWSESTQTGDRSDAPAVSDKTWKAYSSSSVECPGKANCQFGKECFAEVARENAAEAQLVVTNHAVVAHALKADAGFLDDRDVIVFDEIHELQNYLTNAWGATLTTKKVSDLLKDLKRNPDAKSKVVERCDEHLLEVERYFATAENGIVKKMPDSLKSGLEGLLTNLVRLSSDLEKTVRFNDGGGKGKEETSILVKKITEITDQLGLVLTTKEETVVWFEVPDMSFARKGSAKKDPTVYLKAAPLRTGPRLQEALKEKEILMVGTSATIRVSGEFEIPIHNLGLEKEKHTAVALDTPFDFEKQGLLYIPNSEFPSPVGSDRVEHSEAVKQEALDLILAAGGRALILTTTTYDCDQMGRFLETSLRRKKIKVLKQGDAPQKQLISEFTHDETSVLVATIGMWHGLDVQGSSLSLVVMTKVPFKPMNDPLLVARQEYAEKNGRSGFNDVYVAEANVILSQGVGRLIRSATDRGVCAILDTRLLQKNYGKSMLKSLPNMKIFTNKRIVIGALNRLTGTKPAK